MATQRAFDLNKIVHLRDALEKKQEKFLKAQKAVLFGLVRRDLQKKKKMVLSQTLLHYKIFLVKANKQLDKRQQEQTRLTLLVTPSLLFSSCLLIQALLPSPSHLSSFPHVQTLRFFNNAPKIPKCP